jgi:apolipoprotein D and lipocalin family protein
MPRNFAFVRATIAAAWAALLLSAAPSLAQTPPAAPEPRKPVEVSRLYTGLWHELARHPMAVMKGCVASAIDYDGAPSNKLEVHNTCRMGSPTGKLREISGPATILDPGVNAKILVKYRVVGFIPIEAEYWVLDHDDAYSWFISTSPSFKNLWIYTRSIDIPESERQALLDRARALGYDVSKLEFSVQASRRNARLAAAGR